MAANHARVIAESHRASVAFVVDRDAERAETLAHEFRAPATTDISRAFECDAAVVATSTSAHAHASLALIDAGVPVLIEKPLTSTLVETRQIVDEARGRDVTLMCGLVERFNPAVARLKSHELAGRSRIRTVRISPAPPMVHSSVVDDVLLHDLDLVLILAGADAVVDVQAEARDWSAQKHWPDTVTCRLAFASGMTASLYASRVAATRRRVFVIGAGDSGECHIDLLEPCGNALAAQLERFIDLVTQSTFAEREAERLSVLPSHELAHCVQLQVAERHASCDERHAVSELGLRVGVRSCES